MTIAHLISSGGYYGAECMLMTLVQALTRLNSRCVVGVLDDARFHHLEIAEEAAKRGIEVKTFPCRGRFDHSAITAIRRWLAALRPEVLHTHGYKADLYGRLARSGSIPPVLAATCHNWPDPALLMRLYASLDRIALRHFDVVAAVSPQVLAAVQRSGVKHAKYVPNGVEIESFICADPPHRQASDGAGREAFVGFAGRLVPDKGGAELLQAARRVVAERSKTRFVFAGDGGCLRPWKDLAAQLGISEDVLFLGRWREMAAFYSALDVFVLPSKIEAMPMTVIEAMASGVPVVASRVGAIPDVVVAGETGILVEPGDVDGIAAAILQLLSDDALARRLSEQGRKYVTQTLTSDVMARSYLTMYQQALTRTSAGRYSNS